MQRSIVACCLSAENVVTASNKKIITSHAICFDWLSSYFTPSCWRSRSTTSRHSKIVYFTRQLPHVVKVAWPAGTGRLNGRRIHTGGGRQLNDGNCAILYIHQWMDPALPCLGFGRTIGSIRPGRFICPARTTVASCGSPVSVSLSEYERPVSGPAFSVLSGQQQKAERRLYCS